MLPDTINYTFLRTYKGCRLRAFLQYVKKVISFADINCRPFIVGIVADWLFRKWIERGYERDWMENKAEEMFIWFLTKKRIIYKGVDDKAKLLYKLKKSVRFLQEYSFQENLPKREIQTQKVIKKKIEGLEFLGKLDMWFPKENAIWDLKITNSKRYMDEFQLYFFAWLMEELGGSVEKLSFFAPIASPYLIEVVWDLDIRQEFEEGLFELLELIREGHWERNTKNCWGCPVVRFCEQGLEMKGTQLPGGGLRISLKEDLDGS